VVTDPHDIGSIVNSPKNDYSDIRLELNFGVLCSGNRLLVPPSD